MARFYLFGRVQDYSYALPDPDAIVSRRHHLRIWKTDYTIDGTPIWAGAATHDVAIEIAKRGRLIDHSDRPGGGCGARFHRSQSGENVVGQPAGVFALCGSGFPGANRIRRAYYSDSRILLLDLQKVAPNNNDIAAQSSVLIPATSLPTAAQAESFQSNPASPR